MNKENIDRAPPSLDLSFELVKNVLDKQSSTADMLDTKGTALFTIASLILGIGISAGVLALKEINVFVYILGGLSLIGYCFVATFTLLAWSLKQYQTLDNPIIIRKWYWDMEPTQFKVEFLSHLENAYILNQTTLSKKASAIRSVITAVTFEVISLVLALAILL